MQKRTQKFQLCLNDLEVEAIDAWRFEHRMESRSAAIRNLIGLGLRGCCVTPVIGDAQDDELFANRHKTKRSQLRRLPSGDAA